MYSRTQVYARVSSTKQDTLSQWPELERWVEREGVHVQRVEDVGTGKTMTRKGIQSIMAGIKGGEVKRVVCVCLNRLGRNAAQVWEFVQLCLKHEVQLVCLRDGIDLSTPMGRAMAQIAAVFAELDNEMRSEATKAGIAAAKQKAEAEGREWKMGGSRKGYSLKVTEVKAKMIFALRRDGLSYAKIGKEVGLSDKTVREVLLRPRSEYVTRTEAAKQRRRRGGRV